MSDTKAPRMDLKSPDSKGIVGADLQWTGSERFQHTTTKKTYRVAFIAWMADTDEWAVVFHPIDEGQFIVRSWTSFADRVKSGKIVFEHPAVKERIEHILPD